MPLLGSGNYGVEMCDKLRNVGDRTSSLHRFLMFILSDRAAASFAISQLEIPSPDVSMSESKAAARRLEAYREAFQKARALQSEARTARADPFSDKHGLSDKALALIQDFYGLPFEEKAVMAIVVIEGWSVDDAASIMNVSTETVRRRLSVARQKINPQFWQGDFPAT